MLCTDKHVKHVKVFTLTSLSEIPLRSKDKIGNYLKLQKYLRQPVGHGQTNRSVHGDLVI